MEESILGFRENAEENESAGSFLGPFRYKSVICVYWNKMEQDPKSTTKSFYQEASAI